MDHIFFNSWDSLLRTVIVGFFAYITLILLLRAAGKRTLSRMNAYDMVVTMALGSIMARVLMSSKESLSEAVLAMCMLIGMQYGVSVCVLRWQWLRKLLSPKPTVLFFEGFFIPEALRAERVDEKEVQAAIHAKGIADNALVEAVILGSNGDLSVLLKSPSQQAATNASSVPGGL